MNKADQGLTDDAIAAEWNGSAPIQIEFGTFECYAAFRRAEAAGRLKALKRQPGLARHTASSLQKYAPAARTG